ncbi:MAG: Crp/Fnr family transcriptional regulator [Alphaproteobacteria bacterium]|nr:Crp/Fnr family transcriptional regulator [Alphaproteobacteria bacterium]
MSQSPSLPGGLSAPSGAKSSGPLGHLPEGKGVRGSSGVKSVALGQHPERNVIRLQVKQTPLLSGLDVESLLELEAMLTVVDCPKGEYLLHQGVRDMEHYFIVVGLLKRVVANLEAKEMILRFADEREMETSYAAWCLGTPTPYSIVSMTKCRVAKLPMPQWVDFLQRRPQVREAFERYVMNLMSEIMAHTITLHLLDAPGRVHRFKRKHPEMFNRIPQKELAAYLNLSAETLSRLKQRGKI